MRSVAVRVAPQAPGMGWQGWVARMAGKDGVARDGHPYKGSICLPENG
jgi:hypothetical protein